MPPTRPLNLVPWLATALLLILPACTTRPQRFEFTQLHMGVPASITLYAKDHEQAVSAAAAAFARIAAIDAALSDYRPDSELMRLSRASDGPPVPVSEDLDHILRTAAAISHATQGAFDITVGPHVRLWRKARRTHQLPDDEAIADASGAVGWRLIHRDDQGRYRLARRGMLLDPGGIAKGYAAEQALRTLRQNGIDRALVALAGDIAAGDPPPGARGWRIATAGPDAPSPPLLIRNTCVSTSGDTEQFLEVGGVRYSHIVDPRTGQALTNRVQATVVMPDGAIADALASALTVLGPDEGGRVIDRFTRPRPDTPGAPHPRAAPDRPSAWIVQHTAGGQHRAASLHPDGRWSIHAEAARPPKGFRRLFNGRDLAGWQGFIADPPERERLAGHERARAQAAADDRARRHWHAVDGVLIFDGRGENLVTVRDYGDFELLVDWMIPPGGDSGIYLRGTPQVQIWDHPDGSGGLYNNQRHPSKPLARADRPPGEWNTFRITLRGDRVSVRLNGTPVVEDTPLENYWDRSRPLAPAGPIELQAHGGPLYFRNIFVRPLDRTGD